MRALNKKLFRDVWRMRVHALGVAPVLGCGLSVMVMAIGMRGSMERTRAAYYSERHMADLAVSAVRAPQRVAQELAAAPGVQTIETRVSGSHCLTCPASPNRSSARLVSLPMEDRPRVNDLTLGRDRWPDPTRADEILLSQAFADANNLGLTDTLSATILGRRRHCGLSPSPTRRNSSSSRRLENSSGKPNASA